MTSEVDWNDPTWLFAPRADVTDDLWDILDTVGADYQQDRALGLFTTIEYRLACCITHFDDFTRDDRLVKSVRSELNFLRAVWGEIRHARGICPPVSPLLRLLQDCLDRQSWERIVHLRHLAAAQAAAPQTRPRLEPRLFSVEEWWKGLPISASDVPREWRAFDMADAIVVMGIQSVNAHDIREFTDDLKVLANDLAALQEHIQASGERMEVVENAVAAQIRDELNTPQEPLFRMHS